MRIPHSYYMFQRILEIFILPYLSLRCRFLRQFEKCILLQEFDNIQSFNMQITKCFLYDFSFLIPVRWRLDQVGVDSRRSEWGFFANRLKSPRFEYMCCEWQTKTQHTQCLIETCTYIVQSTKTIFKVSVRLFNNYSCAIQLAVESFFGTAQIFLSWKGREQPLWKLECWISYYMMIDWVQ